MTEHVVRRVHDMAELEEAYDVAAAATAEPDDHTSWRFDDLRRAFPACADVMLIADVQGEIAGAALGFRDEGGVRVRLLGVAPERQGLGLGHGLMTTLTEAAWAAGDRRVYLGAEDAAVDFYRRVGFSLVERAYGVTVFERTPANDRRLSVVAGASWLPAGSDAEVYAGEGAPPEPVCLVRVLVARPGEIFLVDTPKGLDLPTRFVAQRPRPGQWRQALSGLCDELGVAPGECIGYVRNVVPSADEAYPFPTPHAHFAVFEAEGKPTADGRWVSRHDAARECSGRHWWPVATSAMGW